VTEELDELGPPPAPDAPEGEPGWGRWLRTIDVTDARGQIVMEGAGGRPLVLLDRAGEGRIALMTSDQSWLWGRGFEGGGPQLELLRRIAHWMMKEPELEEEALTVTAEGQTMTITRRSLTDSPRELTITGPDGAVSVLPRTEEKPGRQSAAFTAPEVGLYRFSDAELERVFAVGPAAPREFEDAIATDALLDPLLAATNGGTVRIEEGAPDVRTVAEGRPAHGRGWIGITPRNAFVTTDVRIAPVLPPWAFLALAAFLILAAWLIEGRRSAPARRPAA
jgi:hypothetical protein